MEEGWTLVQRRQRRNAPPSCGRRSPPPRVATTFLPYGKPSYAQVVAARPSSPNSPTSPPAAPLNQNPSPNLALSNLPTQTLRPVSNPPPNPRPNLSPPPQPRGSQATLTISSPSGEAKLPFPPSFAHQEWRGRCFNCFDRGHLISECKKPMLCALCKEPGHRRNRCPRNFPPRSISNKKILRREEPPFDDLLAGPYPLCPAVLPEDKERPEEISVFIARDELFFQETERLHAGLVLSLPQDFDGEPSIDEITNFVASSGKVAAKDLAVASLPAGRYYVAPSAGHDCLQIALAFPENLWQLGFKIQLWSPLLDGDVCIPRFKVWVDLVGLTPNLWKESYVEQAVSNFGVYLGSIDLGSPGNLHCWSLALATTDLEKIPHKLSFHVGGLKFQANVHIKKWLHKPIFQASDLPELPPTISRPSERSETRSPLPAADAVAGPRWLLDDDCLTMKISVMKEIFKDLDVSRLPPDWAAALSGDAGAIAQSRSWATEDVTINSSLGIPGRPQKIQTTASVEGPMTQPNKRSFSQISAATDRRLHMEPDLSIQVLSDTNSCSRVNSLPLSPPVSLLFPELESAIPQPYTISTVQPSTECMLGSKKNARKKGKVPSARQLPNQARVTTRSKSQIAVVQTDAFIDVPLTYAETLDVCHLSSINSLPESFVTDSVTLKSGLPDTAPIASRIITRDAVPTDFNIKNAAFPNSFPKQAALIPPSEPGPSRVGPLHVGQLNDSPTPNTEEVAQQLLLRDSEAQSSGVAPSDPLEGEPCIDLGWDSEEELVDYDTE